MGQRKKRGEEGVRVQQDDTSTVSRISSSRDLQVRAVPRPAQVLARLLTALAGQSPGKFAAQNP